MTTAATYNQNLTSDKKPSDVIEKDVRKWVESVVEFKAKLDKKRNEPPLEKHLQKNKKIKNKIKAEKVSVGCSKTFSAQGKSSKPKRAVKKHSKQIAEKHREKNENEPIDFFDTFKASYRTLKLPSNWTSGLSSNRVIFNRIKITTYNAQQKMTVERSLIVTKDCKIHVLINGSEIIVPNWEVQKVTTMDDIKKAIKDIDSMKVCEGNETGMKSSLCSELVDNSMKICDACKSDNNNPPKPIKKKQKTLKKPSATKELPKQKSFKK